MSVQLSILTENAIYGGTDPSGEITVEIGAPTAIAATANTNYKFVKWQIDMGAGTIADSESSTTTITVTSAAETVVVAYWRLEVLLPIVYNNPVGVVKCYLYHDISINSVNVDLVYPTTVPLLSVSPIRESIDAEAGVTEFDNVDIEVKEDYTNHTEGFWHRLINGYPLLDFEMMFTIVEGDDETFCFRGKIYRNNIEETEHYLDNTTGTPSVVVRGMAFKLVSSLSVLEEVSIADLITECKLHTAYSDDLGYNMIPMGSVIASMIKLAWGEDFDAALCVNNSEDIQLWNEDAICKWDVGALFVNTALLADYGFFDSTNANGWYKKYANAYDLLKSFCFSFGVIPRYQFGDADGLISSTSTDNKHRLIFNSRGLTGGTATMVGKLLESTSKPNTARKTTTIYISDVTFPTMFYYYLEGVLDTATPPPFAEFDINRSIDFQAYSAAGVDPRDLAVYDSVTSTYHLMTKGIKWYNYSTSAFVEQSEAEIQALAKALAQYLFYRFSDKRVEYTRTYGGIKATVSGVSSQRFCKTLMRHVINDGSGNAYAERTFYATEVEKDIFNNKTKVIWVEE
ncbi:MAG: hypothetical protein IMZ53_00510 [Thermoplasmata archaeon]|nr:hypothetical protein [Thermoplasmata archaeon]